MMSQWRAKALELFPDMRSTIEAAESVGALWIELAVRFQRYYSSLDGPEQQESHELIRAICLYAIWCARSDSSTAREAAWIEFYENVPRYAFRCKADTYKKIIEDLVANVGLAEIEKFPAFGAYMKPDQLKKFMGDVRQADHERQQCSRKR
jgi:hypothetical protein